MSNKRHDTFFNIKSAEVDDKKGVVIEGYANYNAMDRVKERMDTKTVLLDNFKNNPILLFNHDMDYPCGKVIELDPRDDGLYVKARVSGSNHSKIAYIRELVLEGVLKAFSIRYDVDNYKESFVDDPDNKGGTLIKNWELQELSIVTIPCQQDSLFSLSGVKSLGEAREMALNTKGAKSAALINKAIDAAVKEGMDKSEILLKLSKISGLEDGQIAEILAGEVTPIPDQFREACEQVLSLQVEEVANADAEELEKNPEKVPEQKKSHDTQVHENPMLERLDALVAIMGTVCTKLDGLGMIMEGQAKTEKLDFEEPEEEKGQYKEEEKAEYKEEEKMEDKPAVEDEDKASQCKEDEDKEKAEPEESAEAIEEKEKEEEGSPEEAAEAKEEIEDKEELSEEDKKKQEEEEEKAEYKKGIDGLIAKYGDKCKALGIDINEVLEDL